MYWIIAILLFIVSLACLFYFIKTLIVIFNESAIMGILAFLFSPIVHIIFYFTKKDILTASDQQNFKRFFITFVGLIILSVMFGMSAASMVTDAAMTGTM